MATIDHHLCCTGCHANSLVKAIKKLPFLMCESGHACLSFSREPPHTDLIGQAGELAAAASRRDQDAPSMTIRATARSSRSASPADQAGRSQRPLATLIGRQAMRLRPPY
jgi:hypothetical protein